MAAGAVPELDDEGRLLVLDALLDIGELEEAATLAAIVPYPSLLASLAYRRSWFLPSEQARLDQLALQAIRRERLNHRLDSALVLDAEIWDAAIAYARECPQVPRDYLWGLYNCEPPFEEDYTMLLRRLRWTPSLFWFTPHAPPSLYLQISTVDRWDIERRHRSMQAAVGSEDQQYVLAAT